MLFGFFCVEIFVFLFFLKKEDKRLFFYFFFLIKKNSQIFISIKSHYNEERRLGVQRGSDTLVVPLITSNDGLSFAKTFLKILFF
jgi:hypothetical protein